MSSSPPLKIETLPSAWIGCKITTFIWNMQIKFYNLLKLALIYTFFVNLYPPSREKKRSEKKGRRSLTPALPWREGRKG